MIFIYSLHFGNCELDLLAAGKMFSKFADFYIVSRPLHNKPLERYRTKMRKRFGLHEISDKKLLSLRKQPGKKRIIVLAPDIAPLPGIRSQQWTELCGVETSFFSGLNRLPRIFNAGVFFTFKQKLGRGSSRISYHPLLLPHLGESAEKISVLARYAKCLEENIRSDPPLYLWLTNIWKRDRRPEEPVELLDAEWQNLQMKH